MAIRQLLARLHLLVAVAVEIGAIQVQALEQLAALVGLVVAALLIAALSREVLAILQALRRHKEAMVAMELKLPAIPQAVVEVVQVQGALLQHLEQAAQAETALQTAIQVLL